MKYLKLFLFLCCGFVLLAILAKEMVEIHDGPQHLNIRVVRRTA